nr:MAG TPA_asm: hypothetical protein [Caudoviricetes sp.]
MCSLPAGETGHKTLCFQLSEGYWNNSQMSALCQKRTISFSLNCLSCFSIKTVKRCLQ